MCVCRDSGRETFGADMNQSYELSGHVMWRILKIKRPKNVVKNVDLKKDNVQNSNRKSVIGPLSL